jgi:hypothetical protein
MRETLVRLGRKGLCFPEGKNHLDFFAESPSTKLCLCTGAGFSRYVCGHPQCARLSVLKKAFLMIAFTPCKTSGTDNQRSARKKTRWPFLVQKNDSRDLDLCTEEGEE